MQGFDVGGSHKSQQSGYESFGVQNQARVVSEGVDHTEGVGGTGFYEDYYANEEVSVSSLGSDVEMNSPGAAIVTTIKSGGNQFKGLENFAYEPGSFVGSNAAPERHHGARLHVSAEQQRRGAVRQPEPAVLGAPHRPRRSDHEGQALVLRRVQPVPHRQAGVGRLAERRDRPRQVQQLHGQGHGEVERQQHADRLRPGAAGSRSRSATCRRSCRRSRSSRRTAGRRCTRASGSRC